MTYSRRAGDRFFHDLMHVLFYGDLQLSGVLLGMAMMCWGVMSTFMHPEDLAFFSSDFVFTSSTFWFFNHFGAGTAWVWCSVKKFPHPQSMMLGLWSSMVWSFVQLNRPSSSFSSGATLNLVVILMGILLLQRSRKDES